MKIRSSFFLLCLYIIFDLDFKIGCKIHLDTVSTMILPDPRNSCHDDFSREIRQMVGEGDGKEKIFSSKSQLVCTKPGRPSVSFRFAAVAGLPLAKGESETHRETGSSAASQKENANTKKQISAKSFSYSPLFMDNGILF